MTAAEADHMNLTEVRGWAYSELFDGAPDAVFRAHQLRQLLHRSRRAIHLSHVSGPALQENGALKGNRPG